MSFEFKISWGKSEARSGLENPAVSLTDPKSYANILSGGPTNSGVDVSEEKAMGISTVWAAVRLLSGTSATLPLKVYRKNPDDTRDIEKKHSAYKLLHTKPNPFMNAVVFRELLMASVLLWGNGFARIVRDSKFNPISLIPYYPWDVKAYVYKGQKYFWVKSEQKAYSDFEFIHFIGYTDDGINGKSPIRVHMENIGLTIATQQFGAKFFGNGTHMGGFFEHPGSLSESAFKRLQSSLYEKYSGLGNSHSTPLLEEGLKFNKIGMPPEEAQFIETRKFQKSDIAAIFNVPPHMVGDLSNSTNNNIEQQSLEYVIYSLTPWLVRMEQEFNTKLFREDEQDILFAEHNVNALLRGDMAAQGEYFSKMFNIGVYSPDDIMKLQNMNPIPGGLGKTRYRPVNLVPINEDTIKQTVVNTNNSNKDGNQK